MASQFSGRYSVSSFLPIHQANHITKQYFQEHHNQDVLNNSFPTGLVQQPTANITPSTFSVTFDSPHPTHFSVPRELNSLPLVSDDLVAKTDSSQSSWLPLNSSIPPVQPEQQTQPQQPLFQQNGDFTLFPPQRRAPSRPQNRPLGRQAVSQHQQRLSASPASQFAAFSQPMIQSASEAGTSTTAPNGQRRTHGQRLIPPVPLFNSTRPANNMELDIDLPEFSVPFGGGAPASEFSSPANPPMNFDMSGAASMHGSVMSVSPKDLFLQDDYTFSAPASTALTQLTTPSGYDTSPSFAQFDESPIFQDVDAPGEWPSLFPDAEVTAAAPAPAPQATLAATQLDQSPALELDQFPAKKPSQPRKSSSSSSPSGRHSSVSGVSARRRGKPLPPITVDDPEDLVGMKRAKNTLAARKSRARKAERMDELESQVRQLQADKERLEAELAHWKSVAQNGQ